MIFAKSYYRHKQFQFDPMSKRHLKWQIIKVCCCYRNFFGHAARKNQGIGNDKKMKIFAMTKSQKYLQWQKVENIWNNKSLKTFAMTKNWKYLQWQKFKNICDDKKLTIFGMTKSWKYLQWQKVENIWWSDRRGSARSLDWRAAPAWNFLITIQLLLL